MFPFSWGAITMRTYRAMRSAEAAQMASGSAGDSSGRWRLASHGDTALLQRPLPPPQPGDDGSPWPRGEHPARWRGDEQRTSSCGQTCCRPPAARPGTMTTIRPVSRTSSDGADDGGGDDVPRHHRPLPYQQPFPCRLKALAGLWHAAKKKNQINLSLVTHCLKYNVLI